MQATFRGAIPPWCAGLGLLAGMVLLSAVTAAEPSPPTATSSAQEDPDVAEARARFAAGGAYFKKGDYKSAIAEFQAGYALTRKAGFLLNIGVCQRKLGLKAQALETFRDFQQEDPEGSERADVAQQIAELQKELGLAPPAAPTLIPAAPSGAGDRVEPEAPEPARAVAAIENSAAGASTGDDAEIELLSSSPGRSAGAARARHLAPPDRHQTELLESRRADETDVDDDTNESRSWLMSGWLWGTVGVALAGAITAAILLSAGDQPADGSIGTIDAR